MTTEGAKVWFVRFTLRPHAFTHPFCRNLFFLVGSPARGLGPLLGLGGRLLAFVRLSEVERERERERDNGVERDGGGG